MNRVQLKAPYEGEGRFVFFSFAETDRAVAESQIALMQDKRLRVWYDDGSATEEQRDEHMRRCDCYVMFVTSSYAADARLAAEALSALRFGRSIVVALWEGLNLPLGLQEHFSRERQVFLAHHGDPELFNGELSRVAVLKLCRNIEIDDAYEGGMKYIFVSYAHLDSESVFPLINRLQRKGFRIWYDRGIQVGTEWDTYIMDHVSRCDCFVYLATKASMESAYCRKEITQARQAGVNFVVVYLEQDAKVPDDLNLEVGDNQNLYRDAQETYDDVADRLAEAFVTQPSRDTWKIEKRPKNYKEAEKRARSMPPRTFTELFAGRASTAEADPDAADSTVRVLTEYIGGSKVVDLSDLEFEDVGELAFIAPNAAKIILPEGVRVVSKQAFTRCGLLEEVVLPSSVEEIDDEAMLGCFSLKTVRFPEGLQKIGRRAFSGCSALTADNLPPKVKHFGADSFSDCKEVSRLYLNAATVNIEANAFSNQEELDVTVGDSVRKLRLGSKCFSGCRSFTVAEGNEAYGSVDNMLLNKEMTVLISVAANNAKSVTIPPPVTEIEKSAFYWDQILEHVDFPPSLQVVGTSAFQYCTSLKGADLPEGLERTGQGVFSLCRSLEYCSIPASLTTVEYGMFQECEALATVDLPPTLKVIGTQAFEHCRSLKNITLPSGLERIGAGAFRHCESLALNALPSSLEAIEESAFEGCTSLPAELVDHAVKTFGSAVVEKPYPISGSYGKRNQAAV